MENPLILLYGKATPEQRRNGALWYKEANAFAQRLASRTENSLDTVAAVISALSPQLSWSKNKLAAELLLTGRNARPAGVLGNALAKAKRIMKGRPPARCSRCPKRSPSSDQYFCPAHAPKTFNFYHNILNPSALEYVTIDRHAATAWFKTPMRKTKFDYWHVAGEFLRAADLCGAIPCEFQATVWLVIREHYAYWNEARDGEPLSFERIFNQMGLFSEQVQETPF